MVRSADGEPLAGVRVDAYLWGADLQAKPDIAVGDTFTNPRLTSATTDASGSYSLAVDVRNPAVVAATRANDGYLNIEVNAVGPGMFGSRSVVRHVNPATESLESERVARQGSAVGDAPASDDLTVHRSAENKLPNCSPADGAVQMTSSSSAVLLRTWKRSAKLTAVHSSVDMFARYGYGKREDSTLEVGFSYSPYSGFEGSGNYHIGHYRGIRDTVKVTSDNDRKVSGSFRIGKFKVKQWVGCTYRWTYKVRAIKWRGNIWKPDGHAYLGREGCKGTKHSYRFSRGGTFTKNVGTDHRYGADVTTPLFNMSGHHGYSGYSDIYYHFGVAGGATRHRFYLCTVNKDLWHAGIIYNRSAW